VRACRENHFGALFFKRSLKGFISACLLALLVASAKAHDAYEITSVVYLQTNRIELFVEMEFPTAMKLAGLTPTREVAVLSQFEAGLPRLREAAGNFYEITAANNVIHPLSTKVELVVDDHIQFRVEFASTPHRPLHFTARPLRTLAEQGGYGASLTVLDMVNKKVLGQTTLFADSAVAEFSVTNRTVQPAPAAPLPLVPTPSAFSNSTDTNVVVTTHPATSSANDSPPRPGWTTLLAVFLAALTATIFVRHKLRKQGASRSQKAKRG
jgi:hypothetical protein